MNTERPFPAFSTCRSDRVKVRSSVDVVTPSARRWLTSSGATQTKLKDNCSSLKCFLVYHACGGRQRDPVGLSKSRSSTCRHQQDIDIALRNSLSPNFEGAENVPAATIQRWLIRSIRVSSHDDAWNGSEARVQSWIFTESYVSDRDCAYDVCNGQVPRLFGRCTHVRFLWRNSFSTTSQRGKRRPL